MDSQIRRLIAAHGGYAHEIAGCVVAFFNDPRQSSALGERLVALARVTVMRCGTQLTFPASARLEAGVPDIRMAAGEASRDPPGGGLPAASHRGTNLPRGVNPPSRQLSPGQSPPLGLPLKSRAQTPQVGPARAL